MCAPSTSASVIIIILLYLNFSSSKSFPIPAPKAVIIDLIVSELRILSNLCFSTFKILPLKGKIAWNFLFLPCLADPPAESPSTIYISHSIGSLDEQSANFPGNVDLSRTDFLVSSLAFLAASLALAAINALSIIILPTAGFSSKNTLTPSATIESTTPLTSEFPNLVFVCPSN